MTVRFLWLARAMKTLPVGTAYAVWIGSERSVRLSGVILLRETLSLPKRLFVCLMVSGIAGLKGSS